MGVERAITGFAKIGADTDVQHKLHVILPGSLNRGVFGGDGRNGEVKSAFDAIVNRARAEKVWSSCVTFAHPKIGWVRGTGLMGGNDPLVEVVERHGLKTYSTAEIAVKRLSCPPRNPASRPSRLRSTWTLTGGLGSEPIDIKALRAEAMEDAAKAAAAEAGDEDKQGDCAAAATLIKALPSHARPASGEGRSEGIGSMSPPVRKTRSSSSPSASWARGAPAAPFPKPNSASTPTAKVDLSAGRGARTGLEHGPADLERQSEAGLVRHRRQPGARRGHRRTLPRDEVVARSACVRSKRAWATITRTVPTREEAEVFLDTM